MRTALTYEHTLMQIRTYTLKKVLKNSYNRKRAYIHSH